eukprot:CAMPEP_0181199162 /NCGR_PEP_ID=MMETSP1096-20121128/17025_1 /TAXON_ID=156174 ORGANISM="Chrysochromulina ericina, Strain CCMP281" /NCGR_SAMPLE_ID=MMETSP1096 /ASSEMBLY_ACC=CAM_ASM_000453 /LENGTH=79 /DNA_ID=CAMNT_0023289317 /DNA_START=513 /DNA_END=753 /DNA_ORIENTATION=+
MIGELRSNWSQSTSASPASSARLAPTSAPVLVNAPSAEEIAREVPQAGDEEGLIPEGVNPGIRGIGNRHLEEGVGSRGA